MLSYAQGYFLESLSAFLHSDLPISDGSGKNWDEVFRIANMHSLEGVVYHVNRQYLPEEIKRKYTKSYASHPVASYQRAAVLSDFFQHLSKRNISVICIKGAVFRDFYAVPELRSMGDIDCVIHSNDRKAVDEILIKELGFRRFIDNHAVWTYWKGHIFIEIHTHMFYEDLANKVDYCAYYDQIWTHCHAGQVFGIQSENLFVPDEEFHFLYLMTHTAKHILNSGSGFRAYLDMALMVKSAGRHMDWDYIKGELEKLALLEFTEICFSCCERWFHIQMPFSSDHLDLELFNTISEKTFDDGVFGLENPENRPAMSAKYIKRSSAPYYFAAVEKVINKLFPPYEDLQLIPWYSFIDGRPWLLPVVWVYRWGYCIVKKLKHSTDLLSEPFTRKTDILQRQELIKKWGL